MTPSEKELLSMCTDQMSAREAVARAEAGEYEPKGRPSQNAMEAGIAAAAELARQVGWQDSEAIARAAIAAYEAHRSPQPDPRAQMPAAQGGELLPCPQWRYAPGQGKASGDGSWLDGLYPGDPGSYKVETRILSRRPAPMTPQGASEARDLLSGEWPGGFVISADQSLPEMVDSLREAMRKLSRRADERGQP